MLSKVMNNMPCPGADLASLAFSPRQNPRSPSVRIISAAIDTKALGRAVMPPGDVVLDEAS